MRDLGINHIQSRGTYCSGMGLGIMVLDETYPGFPGDVKNPSAYPFPIQYEVVRDIDIQALVGSDDKSHCFEPIKQAALNLQKMGCRAIAGECGYFSYFQKEVASYMNVPVFMSSLLQVSWAQQLIGPNKDVGILMALKDELLPEHLENVGIVPGSNYILHDTGAVAGGRCPEFDSLWIQSKRPEVPQANYNKAERDFVEVAVDFYNQHESMGAMILECTGFQPFARAVQREIQIPVFSWGTLLDYAYSVVVHRDFYGHV